jgi:hypothetical protein
MVTTDDGDRVSAFKSGSRRLVLASAPKETKPKPALVVDVAVGVTVDGEETEISVEDDVMEVESKFVVVPDAEMEVESVGKVNMLVDVVTDSQVESDEDVEYKI